MAKSLDLTKRTRLFTDEEVEDLRREMADRRDEKVKFVNMNLAVRYNVSIETIKKIRYRRGAYTDDREFN